MVSRKRIRQADVARLAGVSQATVSAVLNNNLQGDVRVGPETADRIREAMRQLGYVANPVARSLAGGKNRLLGVFTYEAVFPIEHHDFYYPFLIGIEEEAEAQGYDLLLFTGGGAAGGRRRIYQDGFSRLRLSDGAIVLGGMLDHADLGQLVTDEFPFVSIGRREVQGCVIPYVAADYVTATGQVVAHLIHFGHARLLYIGRAMDLAEAVFDREQGYRRACATHRLAPMIERLNPAQITTELLVSWLDAGVTSFIAEDDTLARALLRVAGALGKSAPEDLSLAVLGDPLRLRPDEVAPEWTCFQVPRQAMGRRAAEVIIAMIEEQSGLASKPVQDMLPCIFVQGKTVGPPAVRDAYT